MNTTDLGELLRGATAGVEPPPGFTDQVLLGGRRRRFRRRITMAASAVIVVAVAVAGTVVSGRDDAAPSVTDQRLTTPTKGDLANDKAFLDEVTRLWRAELPLAQENRYRVYDDLRGEPHVVWAGNTPAGRAAVVVQETHVHQDYWVRASWAGRHLAEGLVAVDPEDGKLKLLGTRAPFHDREPVSCYLFGPDDGTMLIVDEGKPLHYSTNPRERTDGTDPYRPEWHRVQARDGVALVTIPEFSAEWGAQRHLAYHGDHPPEVVDINTKSIGHVQASRRYLHHRLTKLPDDQLPIPNFFRWEDTWTFGTPAGGTNPNRVQFTVDDRIHSQWQITVWLHDRVVIVKETMIDRERSRFDGNGSVLTVVSGKLEADTPPGDVDLVDVERVDHDAVLPVKYRIPDGGGWVVAQKGKSLSYRTQGGEWQDAGRDAAHLPDNAVEVKVGEDVVQL